MIAVSLKDIEQGLWGDPSIKPQLVAGWEYA